MALDESGEQWSDPATVHAAPYIPVENPAHVPIGPWQQSYYDPSSYADLWGFRKLGSGPASIETGRVEGGDFPSSGPWKQV